VNAIAASPIVIDTNVALDLWLFGRRGLDALRMGTRPAPLIGTLAMREELAAVLSHSACGNGPIAPHRVPPGSAMAVVSSWDRHVRIVEAPVQPDPAWPRCRDASDQKFVDLAIAESAGWLLTRDRALLKLSRRCRAYGLVIVAPESATFVSP
jgi:predicted nucleic acid-binding protein